jgi:hypothetical protein
MREECAKDSTSLDAEKINAIQINTGSQYLKNERNLSTANQNRIRRTGQSEYDWICQITVHLAQESLSMKRLFAFLPGMGLMMAIAVHAAPAQTPAASPAAPAPPP